jgi:hypothetical protein
MRPYERINMPITLKKAIAISIAAVAVGSAMSALYIHILYRSLYKQYPDIDRKVVRAAFKKLVKSAVRGDYTGADFHLDSEVELEFLRTVADIEKVS